MRILQPFNAVSGGGTGISSYTIGDMIYASGVTTLSKLADVAVGSLLAAGGVGVAPAWSASPTLTTSLTCPLHIGGTGAGSSITIESTSGVGTTDAIIFKTASQAEAARFNTSGQFGIGITPLSKLHVVEDSVTTSVRGILIGQHTTGSAGAQLLMRHSRGVSTAPTIITTGDTLGQWVTEGYDGSNYLQMADIAVVSTGTIALTRVPTKMVFYTATDAAPSVLTLAMTIDELQRVGIGTAPSSPFHTVDTVTDPSGTRISNLLRTTSTITANTSAVQIGAQGLVVSSHSSFNLTAVMGIEGARFNPAVSGTSGTVTGVCGVKVAVQNVGAGTVTSGVGVYSDGPTNSGGGTFTAYAGFYQPATTAATTIYGFRSTLSANATRWNIYMDGTAQNYIAGKLGLGITTPTNDLSFDGQAAKTVWMERHTTADTAGNWLNVIAGGATVGATNRVGGDLVLSSGLTTGSGTSKVRFRVYPGGAAATTDNAAQDQFMVSAAGLEFTQGVAAFNTALTCPVMYNTSTAGSVYPFLTAGNLVLQSRPSGANRDIVFVTNATTAVVSMMIDGTNNRVGLFGVTAPTNDISLSGQAARTFWMERHTTSNTAGNSLTIQSGGATSGATDKAAGALILIAGVGTGSGVPAQIQLKGDNVLTTGTTDHTSLVRFVPNVYKVLTNNSATTLISATVASGTAVGGVLDYCIEVVDGSANTQVEVGRVYFHANNQGGTITAVATETSSQQTLGSGSLATTWAASAATPSVLSVNANSSLTPSANYPRITYAWTYLGNQAVTIA